MVSPVLFASDKMDWETPQWLFDRLDAEFHFELDAAANAQNAKCEWYFDRDALDKVWVGIVWLNPPYGRDIGKWVEKAYREAQGGSTVVLLIPSRTDTRYWHDYVMRAAEIRLIRGRLKFEGGASAASFPSAVVVFKPGYSGIPALGTIEQMS